MRKLSLILIIVTISVVAILCYGISEQQKNNANNQGLRIVSTNPALTSIANELLPDKVRAQNIIPAGEEPHDYEPTPNNINALLSADFILINGLLDHWVYDLEGINPDKIIDFSTKVPNLIEDDPHYWQDLDNIQAIRNIINELMQKNNLGVAKEFESQLDSASDRLVQCASQQKFLIYHQAYNYLFTQDLNNEIRYVIDIHSEEENTQALDLISIKQFIQDNNIKYILIDPNEISPETETIISELNVEAKPLHSFEFILAEQKFSIMYAENINSICSITNE